jgi:CheY-like chemotaxis protein
VRVTSRGIAHGASTALQLALLPFGRYVEIAVSDSGVGMDEPTRSRVFEPFFTTKSGYGTGLGLSSAYGVVRRHGGDIRVESELGVGTTFRVYLPLVVADRKARRLTHPTQTADAGCGDGVVLVIDDEERVRRSIGRLLDLAGCGSVLLAGGGDEGVALFEREHERISLVMLDLKMPGLDGSATFAKLAAIDDEVPVLLISGNVDDAPSELRRQVRQVLPKPFTLNELRSAISACRR